MRSEFLDLQIPLPIAIIGLGRSGESAKKLLLSLGVGPEQIFTYDQKLPADYQDHKLLLVTGKPKSLCISPGVPLQQDWIQRAQKQGLRMTSELELAHAFLTSERVLSVTGSVGKSTTTSILGAGAQALDKNCFIGGNLGTPLAEYSEALIRGARPRAQWVILELSSYQLENFRNLKSEVSLLTHLSPNHLERYRDLSHYYETKVQLFKQTTKTGILNRSGGHISSLISSIQKSNPGLNWIWTDHRDPQFKKLMTIKPALVGAHNQDNLAMAFAAARSLGWPEEAFHKMLRFPGLEHRLENCGIRQGILFLNDSKATSIESVIQAVESVRGENPEKRVHLLLGGKDKGLPWHQITSFKSDQNLLSSFFGEVGPKAKTESGLSGQVYLSLKDCLHGLKVEVQKGDIVLFSPGGTSLDEFKNFEERGQFFKSWVLLEFQDHQT
jgi:UDP-N-acetylmuramoylalanine--D-glutamate ligase